MLTTCSIGPAIGRTAAALCLLLALAGCGRDAVPAQQIEQEIHKLVLRADGRPAADVSCPEPLPTRSGSSIRCMVRLDDGQVYGVTVKLRSVEGDRTNYDIEVDETPTST
ncbi:MAG: DUF4333 domain-containing protein [Pseudonocardia sp.]